MLILPSQGRNPSLFELASDAWRATNRKKNIKDLGETSKRNMWIGICDRIQIAEKLENVCYYFANTGATHFRTNNEQIFFEQRNCSCKKPRIFETGGCCVLETFEEAENATNILRSFVIVDLERVSANHILVRTER